ncbi:MAG: hypothetical protein M2R45_00463 [Verrucomicrobia subdivision 3 bacterium]|nr:hypothetical protein [Limisphaerales bacterium]MCS1413657.1 hypothetical protein [Limisphaerales bacterium]
MYPQEVWNRRSSECNRSERLVNVWWGLPSPSSCPTHKCQYRERRCKGTGAPDVIHQFVVAEGEVAGDIAVSFGEFDAAAEVEFVIGNYTLIWRQKSLRNRGHCPLAFSPSPRGADHRASSTRRPSQKSQPRLLEPPDLSPTFKVSSKANASPRRKSGTCRPCSTKPKRKPDEHGFHPLATCFGPKPGRSA